MPFGLRGWTDGIRPQRPTSRPSMSSEFSRKLVERISRGEVAAFSEIVDHTAPLREFCAPFGDMSPAMVGSEDCESLCTHLRGRKAVAEKLPARQLVGIRQTLGNTELDNVYWSPGAAPKSDMAPQ